MNPLISDAIFQLWVIAFIAGLSIMGLMFCAGVGICAVAKLGWGKITGAPNGRDS